MTYKKGDEKYQKLNTLTQQYVEAINRRSDPETLHCNLRDLLTEAIKMEITLSHLLKVLSGSSIEESDAEVFIDNVSKHYAWGVTAAQVKCDEEKDRKESARKKNLVSA